MRSIRFIVRRLTSRQVCFPLILSVATISMVTSLIEVARNRPPCFACKEFQMRTIKSISKLRQSREVAEDYNNGNIFILLLKIVTSISIGSIVAFAIKPYSDSSQIKSSRVIPILVTSYSMPLIKSSPMIAREFSNLIQYSI